MARIKIECFEKDKDSIFFSFIGSDVCPFNDSECPIGKKQCKTCIEKNVEFAIKEEGND